MHKLHHLPRWMAVSLVLLAGWAAPPPSALADNLDTTADQVLGQPTFLTNGSNQGGLNAKGLFHPVGLALDGQGNLYVADGSNNRVLEFDAPLTTDRIADRVFGQADFTHNAANGGGSVSAHSLNHPFDVAIDGQGNLYVADDGNNRVLEYDAPLAGDATADRVFGQADFTHNASNAGGLNASSLAGPSGLALDALGDLYVADNANSRVLEYDAALPGNHSADHVFGQPDFIHNAFNNGGVSASSLYFPDSLDLDAAGNLYVADTFNSRVLEYDAPLTNGAADRVFGQPDFIHNAEGGAGASSLDFVASVALDAQGNLYAADSNSSRVLEYNTPLTTNTVADRVFGQPDFTTTDANHGGLSANSLAGPSGVALDPLGNLYVGDYSNNRVLEYDLPIGHGAPTLTAISPSRVAAGSPDFTLTLTGANFYGNSVVRWNGSSRPTTFINSTQLTAAISAADVASGGPFAVTVFTPAPSGGITSLINLALYARVAHDTTADTEQGQPSFAANAANNAHMLGANHLNSPSGVAVDRRSGRLFVVDQDNNRVLSWANAAALANGQAADLELGQPNFATTTANAGGRSARSLSGPFGAALDGLGNLYVADTTNNRVLEYSAPLSSGMAASHVFGQGGSFLSGLANNGGVSANSLDFPTGLALDAAGDLFVADTHNNRVLEYDTPLSAGATADHLFGQPNFGSHGFDQGGLNGNSLGTPYGAGVDPAGNLYVVDNGNNRVLEYNAPLTSSVAASHVFGQGGSFTTAIFNQGGLSASSLAGPYGLALDGWGNLFVADFGNNRVLEYDAPLTNAAADRVFGQTSFTSGAPNDPSLSASSLHGPLGAALDGQGRLYVADLDNHRVLEYDWAMATLALPLILR